MRKKLTSIVVLCSTICLVATGIVAYANVSDSSFSSRNQKSTDNMISETIPENETVNASARKLNTAVNYNIASKDDIYHMMLNTIDYYDKVSGTIYFPAPGDLNLVNTVEFQSVLSETKAYSHYSQAYADNITAESALTEEGIIYMENRFKDGLTALFQYLEKLRSILPF